MNEERESVADWKSPHVSEHYRPHVGLVLPPQDELRSNFDILFKDSPEYFRVSNARMILADNGWVVFHVFDGSLYSHQEFYPSANIHRIRKALR